MGGNAISNAGILTVTDTIIHHNIGSNAQIGGGGIATQGGLVTVLSSSFSNNSASAGGGLFVFGGDVEISGTTFISNTGGSGGGGVYAGVCSCITIAITNSLFDGNNSQAGAGIYSDVALTVTGSTFSNNHATTLGGAIAASPDGATIRQSVFVSNTAEGAGAIEGGPLTIIDSTIMSNSAIYDGGAIGASRRLTITNSTISANTAGGRGGAISVIDGPVTILTSTLSANTAGTCGGGLSSDQSDVPETGATQIVNSTLFNNMASKGGGICSQGPLTITNSSLLSNTASSQGGALYVYTGTQALIQDSNLAGNQSAVGAAIFNAGNLVLSGTTVLSNTATDSGVIQNGWIGSPGTAVVVNSEFGWNTAQFAAGGVQNWISSTLRVTQTSFHDNVTTYAFGGVGALVNAGRVSVSGSSFYNNHADTGAGLYNLGVLQLNGSTFSNNQVTGSGGALETEYPGRADIAGTTFDYNSAGFEGGALNLTGQVTLTTVSLTGNSAAQHGGAIASTTSADLLLARNITVTNNTAQFGGGIFALGTLQLFDSLVFSNSATTDDGGGVYSYHNGVISQTQILSNTAHRGGGIFANRLIELDNSTLMSNTASALLTGIQPNFGQGGGLYVYTGTRGLIANSQFISNTGSTGGGIFNDGTLTVTYDDFVSNVASSNYGGAGIFSDGLLTITNSLFSGNVGLGVAGGGGIENEGKLTLISSTLSANSGLGGGGVRQANGQMIISDTDFISNTSVAAGGAVAIGLILTHSTVDIVNSRFFGNSSQFGGGLFFQGGGTLTVTATLFSGNSAQFGGGAIHNLGSATYVQGSTLVGNAANKGGAVLNDYHLQLSNSVVMSNTATLGGGGIYNTDYLLVTDSTISANGAAGHGGGIYAGNDYSVFAQALVYLNNVTLAGNFADQDNNGSGDGGGLYATITSTIRLSNTIISGNQDLGGEATDCAGTITTGGHNLIQNTTGCTISGTATGDITGTAALLGPLQDNGGPTWTQALLPGSPAVDAGSPAAPGSGGGACEAADQRGISRPQGLACDIGAYESIDLSVTATVQFANSAFTALQSAGTAPITVTLSQVAGVTITVQYSTTDGTALAGQDYVAASGTLTFTPGLTLTSFAVALLPAGYGEPDKVFTVTLTSPTIAILGTPATATVTIHNDTAPPSVALSSSQYAVSESSGTAVITATLSAASGLTATVGFATSDGTALAGSDYTAASGTITFTPGMTETTFVVSITPDTLHEADETFGVALSGPISASLAAPFTGTVTIRDDDAAPTVSFSSATYTVTESVGSAILTATLSAVSGLTATVHYATSNGSALAGSDYTAASGTLTFTPGLTQATFLVPITPDSLHENNESLSVALSSPTSATLAGPATANLTILNDDPAPGVSFSSPAYTITESGGAAVITATLSAVSGLTATVHYASSNGTATPGSDYTPVSGTLTFAPGQVQRVFTVPITNDTQLEGNETVQLSLSGPTQATLTSPSAATLTILDDDVEFKFYLPLVAK